jgi:hypothetical protein
MRLQSPRRAKITVHLSTLSKPLSDALRIAPRFHRLTHLRFEIIFDEFEIEVEGCNASDKYKVAAANRLGDRCCRQRRLGGLDDLTCHRLRFP